MDNAVGRDLKKLLNELMKIDFLNDHFLVGGTNLALRFNHRTSIDIDLFVHREMNIDTSNILNRDLKERFGDRYESFSVTEVGIFGFIDGIKVDLVNFPFKLANDLELVDGARLASTLDIGAMKLNAIAGRGSRKDFYDVNFLLKKHSLADMLGNFQRMYQMDQVSHTIQALQYFGDAENSKQRDNQFISFTDVSWTQVKSNIRDAYIKFNQDKIVDAAVGFHMNNEYPNKIANIEAYYPHGALSNAFEKESGIRLTEQHLRKIDAKIEETLNRGRSR